MQCQMHGVLVTSLCLAFSDADIEYELNFLLAASVPVGLCNQ